MVRRILRTEAILEQARWGPPTHHFVFGSATTCYYLGSTTRGINQLLDNGDGHSGSVIDGETVLGDVGGIERRSHSQAVSIMLVA